MSRITAPIPTTRGSAASSWIASYNVGYLRDAMERHGLAGRWAYWDAINDVYHGLSREQVRALYAEADGLINLCGATQLREEHLRCPVRIMIDTDPVYEQIKYAKADPAARAYVDAHTALLHLWRQSRQPGNAGVPLCGVPWRATRPPVDLDLWPEPPADLSAHRPASRRSRPGRTRARTSSSTAPAISGRSTSIFSDSSICRGSGRKPASSMAMLPPDDGSARATVEEAGWSLVDPRPVSADMDAYRDFIAGSRGEFTVAKDIYVRPNSGWFSDRAVCYLAAGRPVVTMRTGFTTYCPVGHGLFDYATHGTRRSPRSTRSPPIIPATAAPRANAGRRLLRRRAGHRRSSSAESGLVRRAYRWFFRQFGLTDAHAGRKRQSDLSANDHLSRIATFTARTDGFCQNLCC